MNQQKNQEPAMPQLMQDLQGEISDESAPLLQFIVRYAGLIATLALMLLLSLGGMGIWKWHKGKTLEEARADLLRICRDLSGAERDAALESLAARAPTEAKAYILMTLGKSAQASGNHQLAAHAFGRASEIDQNGALGLGAAINQAGALLMQNEPAKALTALQALEARKPELAQSPAFRQLLAETAGRAGQKALAASMYRGLAQGDGPDSAYFLSRANALETEATQGR